LNTCDALSPASRVVSNKQSAACDLDGEMVILNLDSGVYFGLNAVGASIWNCIQSEHSVSEIVDRMMAEYKVGRAECDAGVTALLQQMASHGLIDVRSDG
jgi:hypothetical protein